VAVQNTITITHPEIEGWELFEVGANLEVLDLAQKNPKSVFLQHLSILADYEISGKTQRKANGISHLSPIVEALYSLEKGKAKEAANQISLYFQSSSPEICYSIINLSSQIFKLTEKYKDILHVISIYKKKYDNHSFLKEELVAYYNLKQYEDVVSLYKSNSKFLNDPEIHRLIGMSLLFLDKPKEASKILEKLPGQMELPTFEERQKDYGKVYDKIRELETKKSELSLRELEDMGFAYLFHGDYAKAEQLFVGLSQKLKSTLCTV